MVLSRLEFINDGGKECLGLFFLGRWVAILLYRMLGFMALGRHTNKEAVLTHVVRKALEALVSRKDADKYPASRNVTATYLMPTSG